MRDFFSLALSFQCLTARDLHPALQPRAFAEHQVFLTCLHLEAQDLVKVFASGARDDAHRLGEFQQTISK
jgi:hypothetical protein